MDESANEVAAAKEAYDNALSLGDARMIKATKAMYQEAVTKQTLMNGYYNDMVDEVTTGLSEVNQMAVAYLNGKMPSVYLRNFNYFSGEMGELVAKSDITFSLIDEAVVKRRILDGTIELPKKKVDIPKDKQWNRKQLNSSVLQGIMQGESMQDIAKRILPVVDSNQISAIRNARTMVTQAENQGRYDRYQDLAHRGAIIKKVWMATGDERTRLWHLTMDGQEQDLDEPFIDGKGNELMMPGDPHAKAETVYNCRCTTRSHIVGFRTIDGKINYINFKQSPTRHDDEIYIERQRRKAMNGG